MRDEEILHQLIKAGIPTKRIDYVNSDARVVSNIPEFHERLSTLADIPGLVQEVSFLINSTASNLHTNSLKVDQGLGNSIKAYSEKLYNNACGIYQFLKSRTENSPSDSICIKLPSSDNILQIINDLKAINTSISQVIINPIIKGDVKIIRWENGSFWLVVSLCSATAISFFARVIDGAAKAYKTYQEGEILKEKARTIRLGNDLHEKINESISCNIDSIIEGNAKAMISTIDTNSTTDPESIQRLINTTNNLLDLMKRGGLFLPSSAVPEDVKALFPSVADQGAIDHEDQKLLTNTMVNNNGN